ncbi:MAG: hypothetical protein HC805_00200 [Alkalinema sp. RL_2_19]|nr:hypothetical protein [Alkalinema sp. RL_2_19]
MGSTIALLKPYIDVSHRFGQRPFSEVASMLPRLNSWLAVPPQSNIWSRALTAFSRDLPIVHEHWIFLGAIVYLLAAGTIYVSLRRPDWLPHDRAIAIRLFLSSAVVMFCLSLMWPNGNSAWWWIYQYIPGATAIRVVTRIASLIQINLLIASLLGLDSWFKAQRFRRRTQALLLSGLLSLASFEQATPQQSSHSRATLEPIEQALSQVLQQHCQVAYYAFPEALKQAPTNGSPIFPPNTVAYPLSFAGYLPPKLIWIQAQVGMMWSSLKANVPIINGYSGQIPATFPKTEENWTAAQTLTWLDQQEARHPTQLPETFCYITDRLTAAIPPTNKPKPVANWQFVSNQTTEFHRVQIWQQANN